MEYGEHGGADNASAGIQRRALLGNQHNDVVGRIRHAGIQQPPG